MRKFFSGKRLTVIFIFVLIIGVIVAVRSCAGRKKPDMIITYIGENYFDSDRFYAESDRLSGGIDDVNGDGERIAELVTISFGTSLTQSQEQNNYTRLTMSIGGGESRVYIMDKAYAARFADSEFLADVSEYAGEDALINDAGKVYGISVEGNGLLRSLGLDDTENVYIALRAVTELDSATNDNIARIDAGARKILQYIIEATPHAVLP